MSENVPFPLHREAVQDLGICLCVQTGFQKRQRTSDECSGEVYNLESAEEPFSLAWLVENTLKFHLTPGG